jgi:rod shape-determining protein MreD
VLIAVIAWALQKRVKTGWHWGIIGGLLVSFVSGLPYGAGLVGYLLAVSLATLLRQRVWQVPLLAMAIATFFGTLLAHLTALIALRVAGSPLPFWESLNLVTLPSVFLNLLVAIPVYAIVSDLAKWVYPEKLEM